MSFDRFFGALSFWQSEGKVAKIEVVSEKDDFKAENIRKNGIEFLRVFDALRRTCCGLKLSGDHILGLRKILGKIG